MLGEVSERFIEDFARDENFRFHCRPVSMAARPRETVEQNYRIESARACQAAGAPHTLRQRVSVMRHAATIPMSDHATSTPQSAGMAIAIANIGGFVASGVLQPLVGWVVDSGAGVVAGGSADAYRLGIGVLVAWSLIGIVAACRITETRCRNVWSVPQPDSRARTLCDNPARLFRAGARPISPRSAMKPKVLVTREVFDETLAYLREHCEVESNQADIALRCRTRCAQRMQDKDGVVCASPTASTPRSSRARPRLKVVANIAVGYNNIDVPAVHARAA